LTKVFRILFIFLLTVPMPWANAALTIEITQGVEGAQPIAVVPFEWEGDSGQPPEDIGGIIMSDLQRSGRFSPVPVDDMLSQPHSGRDIHFADWRLLGTESIVVGNMKPSGGGYAIQFQLFDVFRRTQLAGFSFRSNRANLRQTAHKISDLIYETLLGETGAFATQIAYVTEARNGKDRHYELQVADSDGLNSRRILSSDEPLLSPAWSPDGRRLAYVSFENGRSMLYAQTVESGARQQIAAYKGINGAPAWSPDGRYLAATLSKDGNPEIYIISLESQVLRRITRSYAIDTEPAWSPDGRSIVFTSDRGGRPQIYRYDIPSAKVSRVTFEGTYNARASYSPDGRMLVMVHSENGKYEIATMELANSAMQILTDGSLDESPSFAPNGSMVIYATEDKGRGVLAEVSVDGRVRQRLSQEGEDAREPSWSPYYQ